MANQAVKFVDFLNKAHTPYQAIKTVEDDLSSMGFVRLKENAAWNLENNRYYYVVKNQTSLIAFKVPEIMDVKSINVVASHSDSPCLKIKPKSTYSDNNYLRLNVEAYGGSILSTWLDRPLSIAGRAVVKQGGVLVSKLVDFDQDMAIIPSVAIHQNRSANEGYKWNVQIDLQPMLGLQPQEDYLKKCVASLLNVAYEDIYETDLFLYNHQPAINWGLHREFISSARIDNLESVFTSLEAFKNSYSKNSINFLAIFDNEEVGAITKQGMASKFLADTIERVFASFYYVNSDIKAILANSLLVSADNAHAVHPNHPELYDGLNRTYMNQGVVIKTSAPQKYVSDAVTSSIARLLCERSNTPYQLYANRSDNPGGSTQAAISTINLPIMGVDVGCAQLAMHSSYETAGSLDVDYMIQFMSELYNSTIIVDDDKFTIIK